MYFALALRLGMTVRQLLTSLDSAELSEWLAYFQLEHELQRQAELDAKLHKAFGDANG